jgi:hypothetical protein
MPPSTIISAVAPPGGCRQRSASISAMAVATARAAASSGEPSRCAPCTPAMPASADRCCRPPPFQGCAIGLAGTAKISTALAPSGATSQGRPGTTWPARWHSSPVRKMPSSEPATRRRRSRVLMRVRAGRNARHQAREKKAAGCARPSGKASRGEGGVMDTVALEVREKRNAAEALTQASEAVLATRAAADSANGTARPTTPGGLCEWLSGSAAGALV